MLSAKYFSVLVLLIVVSIPQTALGVTVKKKCGDYIFFVKITNERDLFEQTYQLSYQPAGTKIKEFYKTKPGMLLNAICIEKNNTPLLVFNELCWGSACNENIYGVFDPKMKKMLLVPDDWPNGNTEQLQKLLGFSPDFLDGDRSSFFCCSNSLESS
jgi:hypothetical protein